MDLLNESERRFTKKLCDAMIPVMIEAFWEIWLEAKKESQGKNITRVFQELLRGVKTWNSSISLKNTEAIIKNQTLFPNLLAAVFVIHVKILSSIRTDRKSKKICIKLPANDVFVQRCYELCAKDLYEDPLIITDPCVRTIAANAARAGYGSDVLNAREHPRNHATRRNPGQLRERLVAEAGDDHAAATAEELPTRARNLVGLHHERALDETLTLA